MVLGFAIHPLAHARGYELTALRASEGNYSSPHDLAGTKEECVAPANLDVQGLLV
jgi:hypothetical protein